MRRTTRLDVGLAMGFVGTVYLVWALVAGVTRGLVQEMILLQTGTGMDLPDATRLVRVFFVDAGFMIDLVGLVWLGAGLLLIVLGSRQRIGISWAWVTACSQACVAALGGVLVAWAVSLPHMQAGRVAGAAAGNSSLQMLSKISLPVIVTLSIVLWVTILIWLLVERARLSRRGPTLTDGLRTNTYR